MRSMIRSVVALYSLCSPLWCVAQAAFEIESGLVWQTRNTVAVPGDAGSRIDFSDLIGHGPRPYYRVYLDYRINEQHAFRALYAPLELEGEGKLDREVLFAGERFLPGEVHASYRFNSYRLTYRYLWSDVRPWRTNIGFTGKVRDARVALRQGPIHSEYSDLGSVPLLHADVAYRDGGPWSAVFDVDAAAAPQGRAIDLAVTARYRTPSELDFALGYRTLEGGADNERVYAFAWLHYLVFAVQAQF